MERIKKILEEMERTEPLSKRWLELEEYFFSLSEKLSGRKKSRALWRYSLLGTKNKDEARKYFRYLIRSYRQETPERWYKTDNFLGDLELCLQ